MNILIFTDSRGQHKPAGQSHPIFAERLEADSDLSVTSYLCPMKWTTTLDFLEMFSTQELAKFDYVILYTGIVEWSPRTASSAFNDLYFNKTEINENNFSLNTRDYSKKVINNKKKIFDLVFSEEKMLQHFKKPFEVEYAGEKTINMYDLDLARNCLLPKLAAIPNLIYINANRFLKDWDGDYKKVRPSNIDETHNYSDLFADELSKTAHVIDLRKWSSADIKTHTCDNLHLTKLGSDYIYNNIKNILNTSNVTMKNYMPPIMNSVFTPIKSPERILGVKIDKFLQMVGAKKYLATLIIGVRLDADDITRSQNLCFMLSWLEYYYSNLFDILIVEQDSEPRIKFNDLCQGKSNVRYQFIYNPLDYNRGWGYNVAVKHFCPESKVIALMDTDVLTSANFLREILDTHTKFDVVSPYQNIYYTDQVDADKIKKYLKIDGLNDKSKIKNPVTVAGGILIIKKKTYMAVRGFEQYIGYGCEDRAFDVTIFNHVDPAKIRIAPFSYVHIYHPTDNKARSQFKDIYKHLIDNYGCQYHAGLSPYEFIHKNCKHVGKSNTLKLLIDRTESFGDIDLYRKGELTVNGVLVGSGLKGLSVDSSRVIFPPDFSSLDSYKENEIYKTAPAHDSSELGALYNAFKGKRCFIIGNGPSLNKNDLSLLENEYTFGVNSFYYKTRETGFRPYFYVVEDSSVMKENIQEIRDYDVPYKFFPTNYKNLHPAQPNTFFFKMNRGFYEKSSPNFVVPRFSTDASDVLYCGQSVTYINLQLAYFMGFTEVYLIGMDFSYVIPESHTRTGDVLLSDTDDTNHFHKDYFGKGKTWKDPKLDRVAMNYKMAKLVYESTGRKILNATIGGSLEVFERVDYDELFSGIAENKNKSPLIAEDSFALANKFFREGLFSKALSKYVELTRLRPSLFLYKRSAMDCYLKAVNASQVCAADDVAYLRGLIVGLP